MTSIDISLAGWVYAVAISGGAALLAVVAFWPRDREISTDPEPVSPAPHHASAARRSLLVSLLPHRRHARHRAQPAPTAPDVPDEAEAPNADRDAAGADEQYAVDLRRMARMVDAPELARVKTIADVHRDLAAVDKAIRKFDNAVEAALAEFTRDLDGITLSRLAAAREQTGEWDMRELRALVAAEELAGAR